MKSLKPVITQGDLPRKLRRGPAVPPNPVQIMPDPCLDATIGEVSMLGKVPTRTIPSQQVVTGKGNVENTVVEAPRNIAVGEPSNFVNSAVLNNLVDVQRSLLRLTKMSKAAAVAPHCVAAELAQAEVAENFGDMISDLSIGDLVQSAKNVALILKDRQA